MKKNLKTKFLLSKLKTNAYKLRFNYQIPFELSKRIYELKGDEDELYIRLLMAYSQHYMRVKGYYKTFKEVDKQTSDDIRKGLQEKGY